MKKGQWLCSILVILFSHEILCQTYPLGFAQTLVASGMTNPTVMAFATDERIFVAQQNGVLRVIKNGALLTTPFVQLTVNSTGERGLIGIALDPNFGINGFIYLYYSVPGTPVHNRISRFTANGDVALSGSEQIILDLDPLSSATNHNGGALAFGPDGKLYAAIGDNANGANAQNLNTYHGKILRINADGTVPLGNPYATGSEQMKRVWAYGLRNPYTISFQPGSGKLFVNDVGQVTWEEINDATLGGLNFGWPSAEGNSSNPAYTNPVYYYAHGSGDGVGCAITGGTFFNPATTNYPGSYYGKYFFLDFCGRWINFIDPSAQPAIRTSFATTINSSPVIIQLGHDGNLYYLSRANSALYKIIYNNSSAPFIVNHPADVQTTEGLSAAFYVQSVGTTPFAYQWQKDNQDIANATSQSFSIASVDPVDIGQYRVIVSNAAGNATSNAAMLSVIPVNDFPVAKIISPTQGTLYTAGTTISFAGTGTDIEDGIIPESAFNWRFDFHHGSHVHDQPAITGVKDGTFNIPNEGETSDDVWYRIHLTTTDSEGLMNRDSLDLYPLKTTLNFATDPVGLIVLLDDQPFDATNTVISVVGMLRKISVVSPQTIGDSEYIFQSWSHGGQATQTIVTPPVDSMYTANFSVVLYAEGGSVTEDFHVSPNPIVGNEAVLDIHSDSETDGYVYVIDVLSCREMNFAVSFIKGKNTVPLKVNHLSKGLYIVLVEVGKKRLMKKIVVE